MANASPRKHRWSAKVTKRSAADIALSLKRSAERSRRHKSDPYRSAMSMLSLYINRAGRTLSPPRKKILSNAKSEPRTLFHKPAART